MDTIDSTVPPRAEFWQCLAQAFYAPRGEHFSRSLREDLPEDLVELASLLGRDLSGVIGEIREVFLQTDADSLLQTYSSLFLVPPIPAKLNVAVYLDGTLLGPQCKMLEKTYLRHGIEQSPEMHDTPDHLATVLEFLALLFYKRDCVGAGKPETLRDDLESVRGLLLRTVPEIERRAAQTERERALPAVYSALLRLVLTLLHDEQALFFPAAINDETATSPGYFSKRDTAPDLVACTECGRPVATARELKVIADRLRQSGLPADHLGLCPDCRNAQYGWRPGRADFDLPGFR
ncbi:MAG: hypothetical protein A2286_03150 [Gammaproteobacteria bacterium RIFOXYA12_FULL_61_12]|nr:MAG: hypothetical protein A2514_00990 [Gammaproteobacteria bacterium RIFOXYD12_FULL_61_37]OGT93882.1 MAG: hypothetical protein A2286_03150 [Gammaproteobacteria bacterium RIFOXYA12_FULL_61_12]